LILEDSIGEAVNFYAQDVQKILSRVRSPPKVVLVMACHSEEIGQKFVEAGSNHVICIRKDWKVNDEACSIFTCLFYQMLFSSKNPMTICEAFKLGTLEVE